MGIWIKSQGELRTDKSEAMKVLDMIEAVLGSQTVFQMPPAGFSEEKGE